MRSFYLAFLLLFVGNTAIFAQSITSEWMNVYGLKNYFIIKNKDAKEVTVKVNDTYSSGEGFYEKWAYNYKSSKNIKGKLYRNGKLLWKFDFELDSLDRIVKKTISENFPLVGWHPSTIIYEYSNHKKISKKHYNHKNKLVRTAKFEYDTFGNPVKLTIYDKNNVVESYETAEYNYKEKSYIYRVFNSYGDMLLKKQNYNNVDSSYLKKNKFGDYIMTIWPPASPSNQIIEKYEYEYDENGNWIKRKTVKSINGKKKRGAIIKREIVYK